jgi:hypothetical protein
MIKGDLEYLLEVIEEDINRLPKDVNSLNPNFGVGDFIFYCQEALRKKEADEQKQQQEALNNARTFWNFKNTK